MIGGLKRNNLDSAVFPKISSYDLAICNRRIVSKSNAKDVKQSLKQITFPEVKRIIKCVKRKNQLVQSLLLASTNNKPVLSKFKQNI